MSTTLNPHDPLNSVWIDVKTTDLVETARADLHFTKLLQNKEVTFAPALCIDSAGVQFIELDPRKPSEDDKRDLIKRILECGDDLAGHISHTTLFSQYINKKKLLHQRILFAVSQKYHQVRSFSG